jgi:hypothetical protein
MQVAGIQLNISDLAIIPVLIIRFPVFILQDIVYAVVDVPDSWRFGRQCSADAAVGKIVRSLRTRK